MECGCPAFSFLVSEKKKSFNGEVFLMYLIGYGLGRIWIEGLRTDQLLLPVVGLPVSQLLSGCLVVGCTILVVWKRKKIIIRWGDSPFLRIKPVKKQNKNTEKGKTGQKRFSHFLIQNWYKKGGKCA